MEDLHSILSSHLKKDQKNKEKPQEVVHRDLMPTVSKIPDLFFDEILLDYKLSRVEILFLMHLYRLTWCRPNLHKKFGLAPFISHQEVSKKLDVSTEILHQTIRRLETFGFIETIRSGQYFVRKYFTESNDKKYGQTYDNFL